MARAAKPKKEVTMEEARFGNQRTSSVVLLNLRSISTLS